MSDLQDAPGLGPSMGGSGACPILTYKSKQWTVGHPTQKAKTELELAVAALAITNIDDLKSALPPAKWKEKADSLDLRIEAGHWRTWGSLWSTACNGPDGTPLFLYSLLKEKHPEITLSEARGMVLDIPREVKNTLVQVVPDFFLLLANSLPISPEERLGLATTTAMETLAMLGALPRPDATVSG